MRTEKVINGHWVLGLKDVVMPWNCLWGYEPPPPTCRVSGPLHLLLQVGTNIYLPIHSVPSSIFIYLLRVKHLYSINERKYKKKKIR